jgi:hypothetical protein
LFAGIGAVEVLLVSCHLAWCSRRVDRTVLFSFCLLDLQLLCAAVFYRFRLDIVFIASFSVPSLDLLLLMHQFIHYFQFIKAPLYPHPYFSLLDFCTVVRVRKYPRRITRSGTERQDPLDYEICDEDHGTTRGCRYLISSEVAARERSEKSCDVGEYHGLELAQVCGACPTARNGARCGPLHVELVHCAGARFNLKKCVFFKKNSK